MPESIQFEYYSQVDLESFLFKVNTLPCMPPREVEKLIADLEAWCDAEHGRRTELAKAVGMSKQHVTNLLARRRGITLEHYFAIKEFLEKQK